MGLIIGSFLNSIIYRLERSDSGQSFLKGRSFCPHCKHQLSWRDLIPIFSFLILNGKCLYCSKKISWQYPLVELATGLLFVSVYYFLRSDLQWRLDFLIFDFIISSFLIIVFVYDLKYYIIPDKVIYPAIGVALIFDFLKSDILGISGFLLSAFCAAAFFFLIVLISRGKGMGVGDIKLAFLMGLFLGWPNIVVALFSAIVLGAIIGIGLIISGKKTLKSEVPFGPFLVAGTFLALFWGEKIINFYLNLLPSF
jgi:prepilin signal peptidase PulO-like enzyme (type II secretory pathway)